MAKARKDSRGYALRTGEVQRKDGSYSYSYRDGNKQRHSVYAKTLAQLRTKERQIACDLADALDGLTAENISLNQLYDKYLGQKYDLKPTTKNGYKYMYDRFVRGDFGNRKINAIRYSDIKAFYYGLILNKTLKANTLEIIHTQLHPTFQMAVRDGLLRMNPTDGVMAEIKKSHVWDKPQRHALTVPQQKAFMDFMRSDHRYTGWQPIITVLLGTGMRIGECLGLRWEDLDFDARMISVNHTLTHRPNGKGQCERHISTPKTIAGTRTIPMIDEVFDAFLMEYELQSCIGFESETVDGYTGFVFVNADGSIYGETSVNHAIHNIAHDYNNSETAKAKTEHREPLLLPEFSAHSLRHTFCTRLCENESSIKVIQSLMGHSDISTTMDIYAEATNEKKQEVMADLRGKIII